MVKKNTKKPNRTMPGKGRRRLPGPRKTGLPNPKPAGFTTPGTAYGAVMGSKGNLPITAGVGRSMLSANYEQITVGSGLTGTGGYNIGGLVLNPGITSSWPWLASIAKSYQKFRFMSLRFLYVPQVPTSTPGSVFLYMAYDPQDIAPANLAQVSISESSVIGNSWYGGPVNSDIAFSKNLSLKDSIYLDVDCTRFSQDWYYVRPSYDATVHVTSLTGTPAGGIGSLALSNGTTFEYTSRPGTIYFGTNGVTNAVVAGNLYAAYTVEFAEPILADNNA